MTTPTLEIELPNQPIELCKLLKIADLVGGGGEAKVVISEGYVYLNGEVETQKRKKIYHNDIVEFNGEAILVICYAPIENNTPTAKKKIPSAKQNAKQQKPANKAYKNNNKNTGKKPVGGRRAINF